MKQVFTLEALLAFGIGIIIAFVLWVIVGSVTSYSRFSKNLKKESLRREQEAREELLSKPRKWSKEETIIASHIALYSDREEDDKAFIKVLSDKLNRTPASVNRKIKRIIYLNTDNASALDKEIVDLLVQRGRVGSIQIFTEAIVKLTGSCQWLDRFILNW